MSNLHHKLQGLPITQQNALIVKVEDILKPSLKRPAKTVTKLSKKKLRSNNDSNNAQINLDVSSDDDGELENARSERHYLHDNEPNNETDILYNNMDMFNHAHNESPSHASAYGSITGLQDSPLSLESSQQNRDSPQEEVSFFYDYYVPNTENAGNDAKAERVEIEENVNMHNTEHSGENDSSSICLVNQKRPEDMIPNNETDILYNNMDMFNHPHNESPSNASGYRSIAGLQESPRILEVNTRIFPNTENAVDTGNDANAESVENEQHVHMHNTENSDNTKETEITTHIENELSSICVVDQTRPKEFMKFSSYFVLGAHFTRRFKIENGESVKNFILTDPENVTTLVPFTASNNSCTYCIAPKTAGPHRGKAVISGAGTRSHYMLEDFSLDDVIKTKVNMGPVQVTTSGNYCIPFYIRPAYLFNMSIELKGPSIAKFSNHTWTDSNAEIHFEIGVSGCYRVILRLTVGLHLNRKLIVSLAIKIMINI